MTEGQLLILQNGTGNRLEQSEQSEAAERSEESIIKKQILRLAGTTYRIKSVYKQIRSMVAAGNRHMIY